jgi:CheY-like chemotaxis protein
MEANLPTKSILIVEDDALTREALTVMLQEDGYRVCGAANGQDALERLRQGRPPDLILLDLMMPVMNGWDFMHAQMGDPSLAAIPVVICSGTSDCKQQAAALGAAAYLKKPIEVDALLRTIRNHC